MSEVRLGFIGAGGIARRHLEVLRTFSDVRIAAVADPAVERAAEFASACAAGVYDDHRTMLDREVLDAVFICVPPFAHGSPETAVVDRGLPFFVEKPLAVNYETASEIECCVAANGVITGVGYHWRYLDTVAAARHALATSPPRLAVGFWLDATPPVPWWSIETRSGGQIVEQTTHLFDLCRYLVGEITHVFGVASRRTSREHDGDRVADASTEALRFDSGAVGSVSSTCLLRWKHRTELHLFGDGLAVEVSDQAVMIDTGNGRPVETSRTDPVVLEDRDFIDAVKGLPNRIRVPYSEALKTHRVATLAAQSTRDNVEIAVHHCR